MVGLPTAVLGDSQLLFSEPGKLDEGQLQRRAQLLKLYWNVQRFTGDLNLNGTSATASMLFQSELTASSLKPSRALTCGGVGHRGTRTSSPAVSPMYRRNVQVLCAPCQCRRSSWLKSLLAREGKCWVCDVKPLFCSSSISCFLEFKTLHKSKTNKHSHTATVQRL